MIGIGGDQFGLNHLTCPQTVELTGGILICLCHKTRPQPHPNVYNRKTFGAHYSLCFFFW